MPKKQSDKNVPKVVISGDVTVQWLEYSIPPNKSRFDHPGKFYNWQTFPTKYFRTVPSGALLLAKLIQSSINCKVIAPSSRKASQMPSEQIVHSFARIQRFPASVNDGKNSIYRVAQFEGYAGPSKNTPSALPIENDDPDADILVLDDAGQGFRDAADFWPLALRENRKPIIIVKMAYPLFMGALWEELLQKHAERLVVMVSADDLRRSGINISRKLSWERTAIDFMEQMRNNSKLASLRNCGHFIARFATDGAILYSAQSKKVTKLYYDPKIGEEGFADLISGMMNGIGSAFVAGVVSKIIETGIVGIRDGIHFGLMSARRFLEIGFGADETKIDYPGAEIFQQPPAHQSIFSDISLPESNDEKAGLIKDWSILGDLSQKDLETTAINYVKYGHDGTLSHVPIGQFRNLKTLDRWEIESYNSIKNLIGEYLASSHVHRPLSIAVFGAPGSGKTFGVNEVAESIAHGQLQKLGFNLSQFNTVADLNAAFHRIRDVNLEGKIPIAFFDEFDSEFNGALGWIKYFLKPLHDSHFTEGDTNHPIGRAIFVFAGGTCNNFEEFTHEKNKSNAETIKNVKGPDFVSRLRGYINIKGVNPVDKNDCSYILRRAFQLRLLFERKARHLLDGKQTITIDPGVLNAFLNVPIYKHGVRSISAIIEMSSLVNRKIFEQSALPSPRQIELHVDSKEFLRLLLKKEVEE